MKKKKKISGKTLLNLFVLVFSVAMLAYFGLSENGLADLFKRSANFQIGWIITAVVCYFMYIFLDGVVIKMFVASSSPGYSLGKGFKIAMLGQFFSCITPMATGGQPMQVYAMSKQGVKPAQGTSALIQKFFVSQTTLTAYSLLAILVRFGYFKDALSGVMWGMAFIGFGAQAVVIIAILLFSFNRKFTLAVISFFIRLVGKMHLLKNPEEKIQALETSLISFHDSNKMLYKNKSLVIKTYALSAMQFTASFAVPYCIYRGFGLYGASVVDMICCQAFVTMAAYFMPLPGAAGASEVSFMSFFGMFFTPETLKSGVLLWRIITYYGTIAVTAPFARIGKKKDETPPDQTSQPPMQEGAA